MIALYGIRGRDGKREAQALLSLALKETFGLRQTPEQARHGGGKPWFPSRPEIHFNLSHSGPVAVCAVGDAPVGADVEVVRPRRAGLPQKVLSEREYQWFSGRGGRWEDFCALWTLKEAFLKYEGTGLNRPLRTVEVPLLEPGEQEVCGGLIFCAYGGADWRAAVCGTEAPALLIKGLSVLGKD